MKSHLIRVLLSISMVLFPFLVFSQLPYSPCSPTGGKKANILGVETKYRAPGGAAPTFTIPAGTKSIVVFVSSETGDLSAGVEPERGDEDFITINAIIDIPSSTSSGFINYAKSTFTNGSGTNVYGWRDVILGAQIPNGSKLGDKTPDLNNVNFTISGSTLTIAENATGIHSAFYVEYLSPNTNSFDPLPTEIRALLHGATALNTDLVIPIPAGASLLTISGKGINSSNADLNSNYGSEEGYSSTHITMDLDAGLTNGFVTLANGGTVDRRSNYVISNRSNTSTSDLVSSGAITGDYATKNTGTGAVGLYNPQVYVSGSNLIIKRDAAYARDFDDAYTIEFYKRVGQGMSAEFIDNDIRSIAASSYPAAGVTRTFKIPSGTNFIYFNQTANAVNLSVESNENSLAAYGYIDLLTETVTGYYYQMVGSNSGTGRREDNYAFKDVLLDSTSTHDHVNTVGFEAGYPYDLRFTLSADKSELIVTNQTGLANQTYQFLLSADFFGARPDLAFNPPNITFSKGATCSQLKVNVQVCNPGAGNATGGMPIAFYNGDPTVNPAAVLLHVDTLDQQIKAGECKNFSFDVDLSSISTPTMDLTMILNDDGTFVPGSVGHAVGTPFALSALDSRNPYYKECYYDNNIFTKTVNVNSCPVIDPDPDKSSGATGNYTYLNTFTAGSATPANIADADLTIVSPGVSDIYGATITLTNILDAGQEGIYLTGTLPAGITISGEGTGVVTLSGQASQADYIAAIKMLGYKNTNSTPNTTDRIITTTLSDGAQSGPVATTTIKILTNPGINVTGNSVTIPDNSTTSNTTDGTDFGQTTGATIAHSFTIQNSGTGILTLTGTPLVNISGDPGFTVTVQPAASSLNGGASTTFEITFDPASHSAGIYNATITIKNSDADADKADYTFVVSVGTNRLPTVTNSSVSGNEDNTLTFKNTDFTSHYTDADASPLDKIKIVSLPQHGTLMLNGAAVTVGQEIPAADLGNITFVPDADWNGSTSFDWVASDGMGYAAAPATMTININPVNDAPVLTVPAGATVTEETPTPIPGISAIDIDAGTGIVTVTISVPSGGFSATSGGGVTVSGTPDALVLSGTISDINAFIAGNNLNYTSVHNPPASVTVTVNISDNGNTGTGGALQDTKTFPITITAVNTPPTGTGDTKVTTRDVPVSGAVSGTDPDGDALTFTKAADPAHGTVVVNTDGTYTYTPAAGYTGTDNFTITISDGQGGTTTVTVDITVNAPPNNPPTGTGDTKTTIQDTPVSGSVSGTDPDGDALTFAKDTDPAHGSVIVNADGTYTYTPAAGYTGADSFTIIISDGKGGTATVTVNITVNPPPNNPPTGTGDTKVTIRDTPVSGSVSGTDPDGDVLTFTKDTDPAHGSVIVNADGTYTYTPAAGYTGTDNFTILISDGRGGTTTVTVNITVNPPPNNPPTGTGDTKTTIQDIPVNGSVSGTDPDGDALTFTKDTDPAHGSVVVNADGTYTYTPAAGYIGTDNFTITISDGKGGTTTVTVNITVDPRPNTPPTGTGDTKTTNQDTPVNGSVTGTDTDGDALTFTKNTDPANGSVVVNTDGTYTYTPVAGYTGTDNFTILISDGRGGTATVTVNIIVNPVVPANNPPTGTGDTKTTIQDTPVNGSVSGTDPDGDALTFTKATDPAHGSVLVNTDGTYTYTPDAGYIGTDNFDITISDGRGGSATVTVNITVDPRPNTPPTGTGDTKTTTQDTPVNGSVSGTDPDGDALTFTKDTDPAHGSVVVNADGTYTYTPAAGYTGPDSFTIIISDGKGGTTTVTVNITVTAPPNNPPTGTGDTKTTNQDTPVNGSVSGTDPDGDALTFTKDTDPAHGSVVVNADGTYTYTPAAGYTGTDNFTIIISDGRGGTTTVTVNITVNPVVPPNNPPTGTGDTKTTNQDTPVNGSVSGTDPDGDALTFTKATDPTHGSVIVNADGTYTYTPAAGYTGPDSFTITISDGKGGTTTVTVNITVNPVVPANNPPTGTGDTKTTNQDTPVNGSVSGTDPDGDALTFTKDTDPAHGSVLVNTDGTYTYTPDAGYIGTDNFSITISDGRGGSTTVTVNITVNPRPNTPPTGTGDTKTTNQDTPVNGSVSGTDPDGDALTFTKDTDPAHGTVVVNADGTYTYTPAAGYTGPDSFTITISDSKGGTTTVTVNITVNPVVPANNPPTGTGDTKITSQNTPVNGSVSGTDPDGDALTFTKGTDPAHGSVVVNTNGTYTYTPAAGYTGTDNFTITISDGKGGTATVTVNITVNPVVPPNNPPTGTGDTRVTTVDTPVDGAVSGTDPDGDPLTYSIGTDPSNGSIIFSSDGTYTYTPNPGYIGPDDFTVIISDGRGGTKIVTVNITVNPVAPPNNPPIGTGDTRTTTQDVPVSGIVSGLDPDGDALTYTKGADVLHGSVVVNSDGTYTYTPAAGYVGTDNFTVNISDGKGGVVTVTVNITINPVVAPGNNPPAGTGDTKTTNQDTPVNGSVSGTDPDGDALTFTKGTDPAHGSVVVNTDGTYTYTPAAGYTGTDNFTITISDGKGGTTTVTVNITVSPVTPANNPPTGTGDTKTTEQDTPVNGAVSGIDPDGDVLTFTKGTDPAHGSVVVNADGTYTYTPAAGYSGADNFTIVISDGKGGTTTVTVNITVTVKTTTPPVATDDKAETKANTAVTIEVLTNDNAGNSSLDKESVEIVGQPAHGTVKVNEDGTIVYTPDPGYTGEDVFTYRVANANGQFSNTATVRITITLSTINVPNLFTPNGDGKNDAFEIRGLNQYYENELIIVNRWGNEVYRQKGYQNNWKGDGLNEGTYYYLLRIRRNADAEWEVMKGYITLIRSFKK